MPRPLRINLKGAFYHVMNRGLRRFPIFCNEVDRAIFLNTIGEAVEKFGISVHAYALMDNHYHLLIETPCGNLSTAMQYADGVYTQRFNRRHGYDGPLLRGRFKSQLIDANDYFLTCVAYIHLNPVRAGLEPRPLAVDRTSHPVYVGTSALPPWVTREKALSQFTSVAAFDRYIEESAQDGRLREAADQWNKPRWKAVLGSEDFIKEIMKVVEIPAPDPECPAIKELLSDLYEPQKILETVAGCAGMRKEQLVALAAKTQKGTTASHCVAAYLLVRCSGLSQTEAGKVLGGRSRWAVGRMIAAIGGIDTTRQLLRVVRASLASTAQRAV